MSEEWRPGAADEASYRKLCLHGALGPVTRNTEVQDLWWQEIHWVFAFSPSASGGELYFVLLFNDNYNFVTERCGTSASILPQLIAWRQRTQNIRYHMTPKRDDSAWPGRSRIVSRRS